MKPHRQEGDKPWITPEKLTILLHSARLLENHQVRVAGSVDELRYRLLQRDPVEVRTDARTFTLGETDET